MEETNLYDKELLDVILFVLQTFGYSPLKYNRYERIKSFITTFWSILFLTEVSFGATKLDNFEEVPFGMTVLVGSEMLTFNMFILIFYRYQLKSLLEKVEKKYWKTNKYEHDYIQKVYKFLKIILIILLIMSNSIIFCLLFNPSLIKKRQLPYSFYHVQRTNAPLKEYVGGFVWLGLTLIVFMAPIFVASEFLFVILIVYNINELKLIKRGFKSLGDDRDVDLQEVKVLVNQHNLVLSSAKDINEILSKVMTNLLFMTVVINCSCLISLNFKGVNLVTILFVCFFMFVLFVFCFLGNLLNNETLSVADSVYHCNWWKNGNIQLRKQLQLVILRSQRPSNITAATITLNFDTFTNIMKVSFNFFTFTRVLINKSRN